MARTPKMALSLDRLMVAVPTWPTGIRWVQNGAIEGRHTTSYDAAAGSTVHVNVVSFVSWVTSTLTSRGVPGGLGQRPQGRAVHAGHSRDEVEVAELRKVAVLHAVLHPH